MNKLWVGVVMGAVVVYGALSASWVSAEQYDLKVGQVSATYSNESVGQNSVSNKIAELLKQIGELQEKVAKLKSGQSDSSSSTGVKVEAKEQWSGDSDYKFEKNLAFGARNNKDVEKLQNFLLEKGYYEGPVTGNYFSLTKQAVKKFQKENGVEETGYLGPKTRTIMNDKVISCAVGQDCGTTIIKPAEHVLKITTESSLAASVGKEFFAIFKVDGWSPSHGDLSVEGSGVVPGLSWSKPTVQCVKAPCGDTPMKNSRTIYLSGTPSQAGVYQVTVTASSWSSGCNSASGICPEMAKQTSYGKAEFTIVVNDASSNNLPPIINSMSGPTSLEVGGSGTWEIKAQDPESKSLSYSVSWGDEGVSVSAGQQLSTGSSLDHFFQTATFSHVYSMAGEYRIVFVVKDESSLKATASATVLVKGDYVQRGALKIDPSSASLTVGEDKQFVAWFDPAANCDGIKCPKLPVRQVKASWSVTGIGGVVDIKPNPCSLNEACSPYVHVSASAPGKVYLIANYTESGKTYSTKAPIVIQAAPPATEASLKIDPSSASLKIGESGNFTAGFTPATDCDGIRCPKPTSRLVEASWSVSNTGVVILRQNPCPNQSECSPYAFVTGYAAGKTELIATYVQDGKTYKDSIPVSVVDPNPILGKLVIVPSSLSLGVGSSKIMSLFMQDPMPICTGTTVCPQYMPAPRPVSGTWSSSNNSVISLSCPAMPPCPAGLACIQVMPPCTGTTMNATGANQGTARIIANYVDGAGQYYLAESLVTVSGTGTSSSTAASFSTNQQTANVLQYLYETLLGMQSGLSR